MFLDYNADIILHPSSLQSAEFISRKTPEDFQAQHKKHSSLVLYFTDRETANQCIERQISYLGTLYRTARFVRRPPRCFKCNRFGHFARDCRSATICGKCSGPHLTMDCHCIRPSCKNTKLCSHIKPKCALCTGPHTVFATDCPSYKDMTQRYQQMVTAAGRLY